MFCRTRKVLAAIRRILLSIQDPMGAPSSAAETQVTRPYMATYLYEPFIQASSLLGTKLCIYCFLS